MTTPATLAAPQGFGPTSAERLTMPERSAMNGAAADAIIAGPRKAIFGPFIALMRRNA